jgi:glyoxylase-like metal-dependent hydrolase (beta-lactamase superfamily II)
MLHRIAEGVFVHESGFLNSNTVVVQGRDGVMVSDPGITRFELADLAIDLRELGQPVVAAFSTHPHWDHVLWHPALGDAPRYATALGAAVLRDLLAQDDWRAQVAEGLPPEHADEIPMELLGLLTGLPAGATVVPWDGPDIRIIEHRGHSVGHAALLVQQWIIEHRGHSVGHAALLVQQSGVLVAGDMLSDILMPFLDLQAEDPIGDYLAALGLFEGVAADVDVVVPGHGTIGHGDEVRERIERDRAYVQALRDGEEPDDPRVGPSASLEWLPDVHRWQVQHLAEL